MVKGSSFINILSLFIVLLFYVCSVSTAQVTNFINNDLLSRSSNLLEEFSEGEEEMLMESEISRRFLGQTKVKKYITYPTLKKGAAICNSPSYSSCLGRTSNRYDSGCLKINRCKQ
ncbi:hypothetical protein MKX01_022101 [Papaver californicum]|nr:hypothetical protein MKX01_022101 [Papaver californicum]